LRDVGDAEAGGIGHIVGKKKRILLSGQFINPRGRIPV